MICKKAKLLRKKREEQMNHVREEMKYFRDGVCPKCGRENIKRIVRFQNLFLKLFSSGLLSYKCLDCGSKSIEVVEKPLF